MKVRSQYLDLSAHKEMLYDKMKYKLTYTKL